MRWRIVAVGKPALPWARDAVSDYQSRINRTTKIELIYLRDEGRDRTERAMLSLVEKSLCVVLDERGKHMRSTALAKWIADQELTGTKNVSMLIGGADGLGERIRSAGHAVWALSHFTLQHELALAVCLEQIYRAYAIIRGGPYHRE